MLQLQPTSPYTPRVEVPDTTRSFLRLGVSSPLDGTKLQGLAAYRAGPFFLLTDANQVGQERVKRDADLARRDVVEVSF